MRVGLLTGGPGSGKTTLQRSRVIAAPGLYIFALPSIPLIEEQRAAFQEDAPSLRVFAVHHEESHRGTERQLSDVRDRIAEEDVDHAVLLVTHKSLTDRDLGAFSDWQLCIDEAPDAVKCGHIGLSADTCVLFAKAFELRPFGDAGWAELVPAGQRPSWVALSRDTLLRAGTDLFDAVKATGNVFVDLQTWDGAEGFHWLALWTPLSVSHFRSVLIIGASYRTSMGGLICADLMGDVFLFDEEHLPMVRTGQPTIRIHWFSDRPAGKREWATKEGRAALRDIAAFLRLAEPALGFWSANGNAQTVLDAYMPGTLARPKSAGLNRYRSLRSCALFYGAGATPGDTILLRDFGFSNETIRRAREDEDVFQFVMRGAVRNGDDTGLYDVYLYSRRQAETLRDRLEGAGFGDIELVAQPHVIQAMSAPTPKPATKPRLSAADKRARKSELQRERRWLAARECGRSSGATGRPRNPP